MLTPDFLEMFVWEHFSAVALEPVEYPEGVMEDLYPHPFSKISLKMISKTFFTNMECFSVTCLLQLQVQIRLDKILLINSRSLVKRKKKKRSPKTSKLLVRKNSRQQQVPR